MGTGIKLGHTSYKLIFLSEAGRASTNSCEAVGEVTASAVPWMIRICEQFSINKQDTNVRRGNVLGVSWANFCSHCGGVVHPTTRVSNGRGCANDYRTPVNISLIPRREPTCLISGSFAYASATFGS